MNQPTCVIADDHEIVLEGLASTLEPFVEILGRANTGSEAIEVVLATRPDLLFLDMRMPGPGIEGIVTALRKAECPTRVIVFSSVAAVARVRAAFDCGAYGYLTKDAPVTTLQLAVESVVAGSRFMDPFLAPQMIDRAVPQVSRQEFQVLELMAHGTQNDAIALALGISVETVKSHISTILAKLGCTSRTGAVAYALRSGVVD